MFSDDSDVLLFCVLIYAFTPSAHAPPIIMLFRNKEYIWKNTTIAIILVFQMGQ